MKEIIKKKVVLTKWAEEGNRQVRVTQLKYNDIKIEFLDVSDYKGEKVIASLSLASYRALDIAKAIIEFNKLVKS